MKQLKWKSLLVSIAISMGIGLAAGLAVSGSMEVYQELYKPPLSPPGWVFPVVWMILYFLMGVAAWLVWTSDSAEKKKALQYYGAQLLVNALWPILFFRLGWYATAFAWIALLWYLVLVTANLFYKIKQTAGLLMLPYLLWITFAGYLNLAIAIHYV